jgi:hypothetical protein
MNTSTKRQRKGAVLFLTVLLMLVMIGMMAFAVDIGYYMVAKTQMQRAADSAAIAAAWELIDWNSSQATPQSQLLVLAKDKAKEYTASNLVANSALELSETDVVAGVLPNPSDPSSAFVPNAATGFNAVQILIRMDGLTNRSVPFFFAPLLGVNAGNCQVQATAAFMTNFKGFQTPSDDSNLDILPFALDEVTWNLMTSNNCGLTDQWSSVWNSAQKRWVVSPGSDGVKEVNLYPSGSNSPGNFGTVDIGSPNNSTCDLSRQIRNGISHQDMEHMGGSLQFNDQGTLTLEGDTGISAGMKDDLASIIGKPRIIPIYRSVSGNGNNARYTIVKFGGIRILDVDLTGSKKTSKHVTIQPAKVVTKGGISSTVSGRTKDIYTGVWLVR